MVRESLVAAGEAFLLSPTVAPHSDDSKRKFLQTKGLTKDEITAAFAKSRSSKSTKDGPTHCQIMDRCVKIFKNLLLPEMNDYFVPN